MITLLKSRRSAARRLAVHALLLCAALAAAPAAAQSAWDWVPSMDVVRNRLSLTAEQEAALKPIFERRVAQLQGLRDQLEKTTSRAQKRALLRDAKQGQQDFNAQVEEVLDVAQRTEWHELRQETREKVKERYEEKRASQ